MFAELSERESKRRRLGPTACWQFNIAAARPLMGPALTGRESEWGGERLDRFLSEIRILEVSDPALRLFGLPLDRDRALARPVGSLWPEASHAPLTDLLAAIAGQEGDAPLTREIGQMDGWRDVVLTGWRGGDARCHDIVFVSVEATLDAPGALRELEASEHRYRSLISSLPLPVWQVDARAMGRVFERLVADGLTDLDEYSTRHPELTELACDIVLVTEASRDAIEFTGATDPSQLIGPVRYLFAASPGTARRVMLAHFAGQRNYVEQMKFRTFDGRLRDVLLLITLPVPGERLDTTLIMMIDNTAQLEAEARLRQVESDFTHAARLSTLGQMTASIAHEIKQPLSAILTNAETSLRWLVKDDPNLPKVTQLSERIVASAERANDIIGRIQDMAGKRQPQHAALALNEVIREALTFVRHDSEERSIRLRLDMDPDLPAIAGDRIQLQQVVVNLLVNSRQAMAEVALD
ncbi:MAG: histidine kinase dimerization/phospho-acceptor domain-containing protein, partial [Pseudomonadota bacterium]